MKIIARMRIEERGVSPNPLPVHYLLLPVILTIHLLFPISSQNSPKEPNFPSEPLPHQQRMQKLKMLSQTISLLLVQGLSIN